MSHFTPTGQPDPTSPRRRPPMPPAAPPPGPAAAPPPGPAAALPKPTPPKPGPVRRATDWLKRQARRLGEWLVLRALETLAGKGK